MRELLSFDEIVFRLNEELATPKALKALPLVLEAGVGQPVAEPKFLHG